MLFYWKLHDFPNDNRTTNMSGTVLHHISISVLDYLWLYCFQKKPHIEGLLYTGIPCNTELAEATFDNTWIIHLCKIIARNPKQQ